MRSQQANSGRLLLVKVFACLSLTAACHGADPSAPPRTADLPLERAAAAVGKRQVHDQYDLERDEQRGGHTLTRHVARTDGELQERLRRERQVSAASTYTDRETAERVVAATLTRNRVRIENWLDRQGDRPNLVLDYHGQGEPIGRSLRRGRRNAVPCTDALVVLRWDRRQSFYVLTTYPEERK